MTCRHTFRMKLTDGLRVTLRCRRPHNHKRSHHGEGTSFGGTYSGRWSTHMERNSQ